MATQFQQFTETASNPFPVPPFALAAVESPHRVHLTTGDLTQTFECDDYAQAFAIADRFERKEWANKDAFTSIWRGTKFAGTYVRNRRLGQAQGPQDTRHPLIKMMAMAERSGRPFVVIGETL